MKFYQKLHFKISLLCTQTETIIEALYLNNQDNFTDIEWNNLYKLAENTFVEESDSLKHGAAGAGLTDND